jgi:hypothetical protein
MTVNYGIDLWWTNDADSTMPDVMGRTVPIQRLVRRLYTPRGTCPDCPNDGIDVRDYLNAPALTEKQMSGIITGELLKDAAVLSVVVAVSITGTLNRREMTIGIDGTLSDGPFALVLAVSNVTVQLLSAT